MRPPLPEPITAGRLIAIARRLDAGAAGSLAGALSAAGIGVLEVTMDDAAAVDVVAALAVTDLLVGAGTVMTVDDAESAAAAGARFVVSPHTAPDVISWAAAAGVPVLAGAFTATEVVRAWDAGASAVKLFPASVGGPDMVRDLRGPLRDVPLVPTGGIDASSARAYLDAGAVAVGVGSWLTGGDPERVRQRAAQLAAAIR